MAALNHPETIAVIGLGALFPKASSPAEYWENITGKRDCLETVPESRWRQRDYFDEDPAAPDKLHCRRGGFVPDIPFDPVSFGLPPNILEVIDTAQLMSLHVARETLADAGYPAGSEKWDHRRTGVVLGVAGTTMKLAQPLFKRLDYPLIEEILDAAGISKKRSQEISQTYRSAYPGWCEDAFPGLLANVVAGRISNRLDLGGLNFTVDAACASSLCAINLATTLLQMRQCDMVITGGVDTDNSAAAYMSFAKTGILSPSGQVRSFDQHADGTLVAEGIGLFALKRLADAQRDGDRVYAQIRGFGAASDGRSKSIYAPHQPGQIRALQSAYASAGIPPSSLGLIEAHSPGTRVGDGIEVGALREVFESDGGMAARKIALGSVKSQIGHCKAAAGAAGLMKAVLALHHQVIPPTLNVETPNPDLRLDSSPFYLNTEARPWAAQAGQARRAGVNALGFGGTNYHTILEQAPLDAATAKRISFSASRGENGANGQTTGLALMFSGQGSQFVGMGRDLALKSAVFRSALDTLDGLFRADGKAILSDVLFPPPAFTVEARHQQEAALKDTHYAQAALAAIEMAQYDYFHAAGLRPTCVFGHSFGELTALWAAGAMDEATFLQLVYARGKVLSPASGVDAGTMLSVRLGVEDLPPHLESFPAVEIANLNAPEETVVGGSAKDIAALAGHLQGKGIGCVPLKVAAAFHTRLVDYAKNDWQKAVQAAALSAPRIPVYSNSNGLPYPDDPGEIKTQLASHPFQSVRFVEQVGNIHRAGCESFLEIGPKGVLSHLLGKTLPDCGDRIIASYAKPGDCMVQMDAALQAYGLQPPYLPEPDKPTQADLSSIAIQLSAAGYVSPETREAYAQSIARLKATPPAAPSSDPIAGAIAGQLPGSGQIHLATLEAHREFLSLQREFMAAMMDESADPSRLAQLSGTMDEITRVHGDYIEGQIQSLRETGSEFGPRGSFTPVDEEEPASTTRRAPSVEQSVPESAGHDGLTELPQTQNPAATLLRIISEKTGYPVEVILPEMDLEADLGIDSIKRVEIFAAIQGELGLDIDGSQLVDLRTLGEIAGFFQQGQPSGGEPPEDSGQDPVVNTIPSGQPGSGELSAQLIAIITEKTGYPAEVIHPDMDLEADLGIDSIKRVEIFAAVQELLEVQLDPSEFTESRSVGEIASQLAGFQPSGTGGPASKKSPEDPPLRKIPLMIEKSVELALPPDLSPALLGTTLILSDGGPMAAAVAKNLEDKGCRVGSLSLPDIIHSGSLAMAPTGLADTNLQSVLFLWEQAGTFQPDDHAPLLIRFCGLIKPVLEATLPQCRPAFHLLAFEAENQNPPALHSCIRALARTLAFEWPEIRVTSAFFDSSVDAQGLLRACSDPDAPVESRLSKTARSTCDWMEIEVPSGNASLSRDDVFLVSGGGRGITAACVLEMSRRISGGRFILLGRTPLEEVPEGWLGGMEDGALKKQIAVSMTDKGKPPKPKEIESEFKKLSAIRDIRENLKAIEDAGGEAVYCCADIVDLELLKKSLEPQLKKWGKVKGIIHGAGVLADNLVEKLNEDDFRRVYQPKVRGLDNLLSLATPEDLKWCLVFSSVAAAFGNAGQSLYAIANQVLNDRVEPIRTAFPQARVYSLNWGPWDAGMVTPALKQRFLELGIHTLPVAEGTRIFCDLALAEDGRLGNVVIGDKMIPPHKDSYLTEQKTLTEQETKLAKEHLISGRPVLPAAWAMQWMLEAASHYFPSHAGIEVAELRVLNGIFPDENPGPYTVRLEGMAVENDGSSCLASIISSEASGGKRTHYSCVIRFPSMPDQLEPIGGNENVPTDPLSGWQDYRQGFIKYGPAFHGVSWLVELNESRVVTVIEPPGSDTLFNPMAYDLATHGILIWLERYHGSACLPAEVRRYRQVDHLPPDLPLVVSLEIAKFQPPMVEFRFVIRTESGETLAVAEGLRMTLTTQLETVPA